MKILVLADIHGQMQKVRQLADQLAAVDLVLLVGDIGVFRKLDEGLEIVDYVRAAARQVLAIAGNCDPPQLEPALQQRGISLHAKVTSVDEFQFAGLGGSLPCPSPTPHEYSEVELADFLQACSRELTSLPQVLVSHQPPAETMVDLADNGRHVGSAAVRQYIERTQPLACVCGHIHEGRGTDRLGSTMIVNPGTFAEGYYAIVEITADRVHAELSRLS